jgi:hypothetical protein
MDSYENGRSSSNSDLLTLQQTGICWGLAPKTSYIGSETQDHKSFAGGAGLHDFFDGAISLSMRVLLDFDLALVEFNPKSNGKCVSA